MRFIYIALILCVVLIGCNEAEDAGRMETEYIYWSQKVSSTLWMSYEISKPEGIAAVEEWIEKNQNWLEVPELAILPDKILYRIENSKRVKEYILLETYPKDFSPKADREYVEHLPESEIERLVKIFEAYGESKEVNEGPFEKDRLQ